MAKFTAGLAANMGLAPHAPLFYSLFKALSIPAIGTLGMAATLRCGAGVGVIGAVEKAIVIRYRDHGAGASAIGLI